MNQMLFPKLKEEYESRKAAYEEFVKITKDQIEAGESFLAEVLTNLSIVSGTIAAAGLASLNIPVEKADYFIIVGSLLLFYISFRCFIYLLLRARERAKDVMRFRRGDLKELEDIVNDFEQTATSTNTKEGWEKYAASNDKFEEKQKGQLSKFKRDMNAGIKESELELILVLLLVVSGGLLILGFAYPWLST